jgi:hypothetical protein
MTEERGSRRMIEERIGPRTENAEADIQRLIELSRAEGVRVVRADAGEAIPVRRPVCGKRLLSTRR